ncbi:MAG: U32 family peptidase [Planctomycetaceae bacterium]|jgi:putative protease|nr:U32 family peptidase [Planctomycetaceae bacterium]
MSIPELLAPAGSEQGLRAAVESGADAVYFGLAPPDNFNARNRSGGFPLENLADVFRTLHKQGVRGYITLNTLIHYGELCQIETILEKIADADADAVIVQDLGVAKLAQAVCSDLPIHASTQMSLTSAASIEKVRELGIKRAVLPRELSLKEIQSIRKETDIELECFIHGALCISFSGQCYASLCLGGRSANRGCCAQPCRLQYELRRAGTDAAFGAARQLFSPFDFSALPLLNELTATGIDALKIEGRLKPPEYVAEVTKIYRDALNTHTENAAVEQTRFASFSRGFSTGWLEGVRPHKLVSGNVKSHRGTPLAAVIEVRRDAAVVQLSAAVRRGDGVLFENTHEPEHSQGGRVYEIIRRRESVKEAESGARVLLTFANNSIDAQFVAEGQSVWKTDDPRSEREIRKQLESPQTQRRVPLYLAVKAVAGAPIEITAVSPTGLSVCLTGDAPLEVARQHPLTETVLREQLDRFGNTIYAIGTLTAVIEGKPMLPLSLLGQLRRQLLERLNTFEVPLQERIVTKNALEILRTKIQGAEIQPLPVETRKQITHILYRHLPSALVSLPKHFDGGCRSFYGEFCSKEEYKTFAEAIQNAGAEFVAVLPRILKPGESKLLHRLAELQPDAVLARNIEELVFFRNKDIPVIADFSFNVINDLSFRQLLDWGAERITLGFDMNEKQTEYLLRYIPARRIEQIVSGRFPLFTMEHCLWRANFLSENETCNKMCRSVPLDIKDRRGAVHTVRSDYFCRNIIERSGRYDAEPLVEHIRYEYGQRDTGF